MVTQRTFLSKSLKCFDAVHKIMSAVFFDSEEFGTEAVY